MPCNTIALVLPSTPGYSETFFRNKIAGLQKNGVEVILFVANSNKTQQNLVSKIYYAPKLNGSTVAILYTSVAVLLQAFFFNFKISVQFLKLEKKDGTSFTNRIKKLIANHFILQHKPDWLHFGFGTMTLGRENAAQAIGAKMAVSFRGFDHYVFPIKNPNCYDKLFSKNVKYHVLSKGMQQSLVGQGVEEKDVKIITPAIDLKLFSGKQEYKKAAQIQFLTIARLHWIKGLEATLDALFILKNQGIHFHYTIIGDGAERERLIFAAHQLGLENNVTFTGKLTPDEVKLYLEKAEIYIQYSIQEGFCNAVLEAQAMGLLCIVSDADGLTENVNDKQTGWVVPKRNPTLLAQKIKEVLQLNHNQKNEMATNAVERVRTKFSIEKQTQEFLDFYTS
jgi:glycosyltransferase involved in cell wall biosynthesis